MYRALLMQLVRPFAVASIAVIAGGCGPTYPLCNNDEDCHEGEFCVEGQCQLCRDDGDCPAGQQCTGGRCDPIDGYCDANSPCPSGQECQNNRCIAMSSEELPPVDNTPQSRACQLEPVYFSFDAEELDAGTRDLIAANVRCIRDRNIQRVHVTGYTDSRGTEEYNLALGDRRARAVIDYMGDLGADRSRLTSSSMGEEMAQGESEASWRLDRKVTFTER